MQSIPTNKQRFRYLTAFVVATSVALILAMFPATSNAKTKATCPVVSRITVKHAAASLHQRRMVTRVLNEAARMRAPYVVLVASIATVTQESTATNLRGGDRDSVGLFQIRRMHGTYKQRYNPEWSARWFVRRALGILHHRPHIRPAALAQAVQGSAHPSAYRQWVPEAKRSVRRWYCH